MRIKHDLVPLAWLDKLGKDDSTKANFRLERSEVQGSIESLEQDIAEARADRSMPKEAVEIRVAAYEERLQQLKGFMAKIDAAGGSYAYMPQKFIDTFASMSPPARALAVDLAMLTDKLDGDLTRAEIEKIMWDELGPATGTGDDAWNRALYAEVIGAVEQARAKAASPPPQRQGVPTGGSPLATRMQNMTAPKAEPKVEPKTASAAQQAALASIAAHVPAADAIGQSVGGALAGLVKEQLAEAQAKGRSEVILWADSLDRVLKPAYGEDYNALSKGYADVVAALNQLGYSARSDGDMVRFEVKADQGDAPAVSKEQFLGALAGKLPTPPGAADGGARLGQLVREQIQAAVARGENRATIETGQLDRALEPAFDPPYDAYRTVAQEIAKLGYRTDSDGFIGVMVSWDRSSAQTATPESMKQAIRDQVPPAGRSPADQIAEMVSAKIEAAQRQGRTSFDLEPSEIDSILKPVFGAAHEGYQPIAEELKKQGFSAFADGFIGVNAGWDD